jgi:hypothetical protein
MSQTAARPWWADVQHLRPDEDGGKTDAPARTGRFDRERTAGASARRRSDAHAAPSARAAGRAAETEARVATRPVDVEARAAEIRRRRPRREPEVWLDATAPAPAAPAPAAPTSAAAPAPAPAAQERRTITIRGQVDRVHGVAPVSSPGPQRLRGRRADERVGPRPDRVAMWAVLLGLLLILVAVISSPGADAAALLPLTL